MLNSVRSVLLALPAIVLTACDPAPPEQLEPLTVEAGYRLLFNDLLVGNALFVLDLGSDGSYSIDALTLPAGQMRQTETHQVLEHSRGTIDSVGVRPERFEHSVMLGQEVQLASLRFDWQQPLLRHLDKEGERTRALTPGTQDRLSYLLAAWQLAVRGEGRLELDIASVEATEHTQLRVVGAETIDTPLGQYEALAVQRVTTQANRVRALWFSRELGPLPLRVVHGWAGSTVDMQLESLSRSPRRPR